MSSAKYRFHVSAENGVYPSFAAVVYTGNETKFGQNKSVPEMKLTHSDRMINWFTVIIFCFQVAFLSRCNF